MYYQLTDRFIVSTDLSATWDFFSKAENLPLITPPWMKFRIDTRGPIHLGIDSIIDYTIRWMGFPVRWRTRIIDFSPPHQFIDLQIRGPYTLWHHQHRFASLAGGAETECHDRVLYNLPAGILGRAVNAAIVKRQLTGIFEYRQQRIAELLGAVRSAEGPAVAAVN